MVVALICGGGNGAHVMSATASLQPNMEVRVLTLFQDEAERWSKAMAEAGGLTIQDTSGPSEKNSLSKPIKVSKDPAQVAVGADVILFAVPAFAHEQYITELRPYVKPGTIIVGLPGQPGFDFAVRGIWGEMAKQCTIMTFITLPWNCRIMEFGKKVWVMSKKEAIPGSFQLSQPAPSSDPLATVQSVIGPTPILNAKGHILGVSLSPSNPLLHPTIMFNTWSKWDGKPLDSKPLFYNDMTQESADHLSACSDEVCDIAKALMQQRPQVDLSNVEHALDYYVGISGDEIKDKSSLFTIIRTNAGFQGLTHPMKETDDGKFVPDFKFRYLWEDIPFGMAVIRGIAAIAGVETPNIDRVLTWAQGIMGKEYLVDGKFVGKDVPSTRAPQKYGMNTIDQILGLH